MKKLIYLMSVILAATAMSCGDDDPVIPRDRDIEFTVFELFHIDATTPIASLQSCDITIHRQTLTGDITFSVPIDGGQAQAFALKGVALTYDQDKNHYTARTATTGDPRITNLVLIINCNDYIADMAFMLDGKQVTGTSNQIFYNKTNTVMTYSDGKSYTDLYANYLVDLHPDGNSTTLKIGNLTHSKDVLNYTDIAVEGLTMSVTGTGYHLTGDSIVTTKGHYSRYDYSTGSPTTAFGDSLFLRFDNVAADLNVINNTMTGSWTMVRLKRVTDTLQRSPQVVTQQRMVEVNRTRMVANGNVY